MVGTIALAPALTRRTSRRTDGRTMARDARGPGEEAGRVTEGFELPEALYACEFEYCDGCGGNGLAVPADQLCHVTRDGEHLFICESCREGLWICPGGSGPGAKAVPPEGWRDHGETLADVMARRAK